jgi:hypothetical protein
MVSPSSLGKLRTGTNLSRQERGDIQFSRPLREIVRERGNNGFPNSDVRARWPRF